MKYLAAAALVLVISVSFAARSDQAQSQTSKYNFAALAMDGSKVDTAALRGKVVVINLWFVNCPNCIEEMKLLNQLVTDYRDNKDVVFLGLAASRRADVERFLKKNAFKYVIIPDAATLIVSKFGTPDKKGDIIVPFPMHFVLDRDGNAVVQTQGVKGVEAVKKELAKQFPTKSQPAK
jgi:peroxiredoxin